MGYPRFRRARAHKVARRTSGDITLGTSWAALDTGLDLTLEAQVGDTIEYGINGMTDNNAAAGAFDVATLVSSAPVTYFSSGTTTQPANGAVGWYSPGSQYGQLTGGVVLVLGASDVSAGVVTVRLLGKGSASKTVFASTASNLLSVWAKNLGPVDPN